MEVRSEQLISASVTTMKSHLGCCDSTVSTEKERNRVGNGNKNKFSNQFFTPKLGYEVDGRGVENLDVRSEKFEDYSFEDRSSLGDDFNLPL